MIDHARYHRHGCGRVGHLGKLADTGDFVVCARKRIDSFDLEIVRYRRLVKIGRALDRGEYLLRLLARVGFRHRSNERIAHLRLDLLQRRNPRRHPHHQLDHVRRALFRHQRHLPRIELECRRHKFAILLDAAGRLTLRDQRRLDRVDSALLREVLEVGAAERRRQILLRRLAPELRPRLRSQFLDYLRLRLGQRVAMSGLIRVEL
ncbi:MAG: hypothetical protein ABSD30_14610, partial [Candidatus Binatus sp.]